MNKENYKRFVMLSKYADQDENVFEKSVGNKLFSFHRVSTNESDVEFYCYYGAMNQLMFLFRGSEHDKRDWICNFKGWSVPYGNTKTKIRVHKGFYDGYQTVRPIIHELCEKYKSKPFIVCAGHSQGGALATLCAVDIQYNYDENNPNLSRIFCYTYGSPRVFNIEGADSFNRRVSNSYRVYNIFDIVPNVPLISMGFKHVGSPYKIGNNPFNDLPWNHDLDKSYIKYL